jgi:hypothetical protein
MTKFVNNYKFISTVYDTLFTIRYAANKNATSSIPDAVLTLFTLPTLSSHTMTLDLTQPLIELNT